MAGFFGFFDYSKPGKGVRKDEPQKPRFVRFWELFFRKFWKMIQLNLLYVLFWVPTFLVMAGVLSIAGLPEGALGFLPVTAVLLLVFSVTVGPATAAFFYILRNFANEQPVFLFSDFIDCLKSNFKQSSLYTLLLGLVTLVLSVAWQFYFQNVSTSGWMFVPAALCVFMVFMVICNVFYSYLMIVTLDLPLKGIVKNGFILSVLCLKHNLFTVISLAILLFLSWLFPVLGVLFFVFLGFSMLGFIISFNSFPGIQKYAIDPFLAAAGPVAQEPEKENVFRDEQLLKSDDNAE